MGLVTRTVKVKWNPANRKHYESLGYIFTKYGEEFEADVNNLPKGSHIKVECFCDNCKKDLYWAYSAYNKYVKEDGKTYCSKCGTKLYGGENTRKTKLKNGKSFYDWCIENNRQDVLDRWDYELNDYSPKDVSYNTNKKMWLKCNKHSEHKSELKNINNFASGNGGTMDCKQCNSFAQWCIDNNRQDILDRWDYDLNNCSPWEISYGSRKKYWFKCDKHKEHKSELKNINHFTSGQEGSMSCKQCNSIARYILDNFPNKKLEEVWDYEKNGDLDPWNIDKGSNKKYWFICQERGYHGSYEIISNTFYSGARCPFCSSIKVHPLDSLGQYIIDNYEEEFLWKIWSDKNEINPFEISIHSKKRYWWNCPDNKHKSFERSCNESTRLEFRCPKCSEEKDESIIEGKTRLYLEELGYEVKTEHNCTIRPINPKTNYPLPFDNEIVLNNGKHLIIEVHGEQHYYRHFYMTIKKKTKEEAEKELHYQQVKDRYKRIKCIQAGYEYLELPYTAFDKKDTYKKMIDNKIKEILNK